MTGVRILLLVCVVIWGWTFIALKVCLLVMHPMQLVALRFGIGLPILFGIIRWKKIPFDFTREDLITIIAGSSIIAAHFILQAIALRETSATKTSWLLAVSPLALAVLSFFFLRERLARIEIVGIALASCGVLLLVFNGDSANFGWLRHTGDWIILISAFTWAGYTMVSRDLSRRRNPLAVTLLMFIPLTVISISWIFVTRDVPSISTLPASAIGGLLYLAVPGVLAQWMWQEGVSRLGASKAGVFLYLEPIATMTLSIPLLHEPATIYTIVGGSLVLGGVWIAEQMRHLPELAVIAEPE